MSQTRDGASRAEAEPAKELNLSPFLRAWRDFDKAAAAEGHYDPTTLGTTKKYLRNRLWLAFAAGWNAAQGGTPND